MFISKGVSVCSMPLLRILAIMRRIISLGILRRSTKLTVANVGVCYTLGNLRRHKCACTQLAMYQGIWLPTSVLLHIIVSDTKQQDRYSCGSIMVCVSIKYDQGTEIRLWCKGYDLTYQILRPAVVPSALRIWGNFEYPGDIAHIHRGQTNIPICPI